MDTNIKYLIDNNINIWNKDAYNYYVKCCKLTNILPVNFTQWLQAVKSNMKWEDNIPNNYKLGDLGRVYGYQLRDFNGEFDQLDNLIKNLIEKPLSTRHIVTYVNPLDKNHQALPPCHSEFQVMVYPMDYKARYKIWFNNNYQTGMEYNNEDIINFDDSYFTPTPMYKFDLVWKQESVDVFLGLPFNIVSYATLANILGKVTNMVPSKLYGSLRNIHIYDNAIDAVKEQLSRDVNKYNKCELEFKNNVFNIFKFKNHSINWLFDTLEWHDFKLNNYKSYPAIKAEMLERRV